MKFFRLISALVLFSVTACTGSEPPPATRVAQPAPAYARVPAGGDNPADNGPDDSTRLDDLDGGVASVPFSHARHASNQPGGYAIPCRSCHHTTKPGEDPSEGCLPCHAKPDAKTDPAHRGPDDNLILGDDGGHARAVGFTHFTHASTQGGHSIGCDRCHHTGDLVACDDCHGALDTQDGQTRVPRLKRAMHRSCQNCHRAERAASSQSQAPVACVACHGRTAPPPLATTPTLERAYHRQCLACHQAVATHNPGSKAPVRECAGCHREAKK